MSERYGIYFMPGDASQLARFGDPVLGRSAAGLPVDAPANDFTGRSTLVSTACQYGFHATLKAPFELRAGATAELLESMLRDAARALVAVPLVGLQPARIGSFCALLLPDVEAGPASLRAAGAGDDSRSDQGFDELTARRSVAGVNQLASLLVDAFEPLRAPLSDADIKRRQAAPLSARERQQLERYGYPYVHDTFRFHMTLSSALPDPEPYLEWLQQRFEQVVSELCWLDRLALAWQPDRRTPFRRLAELQLPVPQPVQVSTGTP